MDLLSELRYPSTLIAKFASGVLAILLFLLVATALISVFVLYHIVAPASVGGLPDTSKLLGNPETISVSGPGIAAREGVFFRGQIGAPTILMAHGYQSDGGEVLTLATTLQENQYNVLLFSFSGHGRVRGLSSLGPREAREVLAAIEVIAQRDDVDRARFGVWGTNMGAYAALAAAATDRRIRAVFADSVYDSPYDELRLQVDHSGLGGLPLVQRFCRWGYALLNFSYRRDAPLSQRLSSLAGVAKTFVQARDSPELAESTLRLFMAAPEPRQQGGVPKSDFRMMTDEEKRSYENQVVSFFLQNLPPTPAGPR
jgi:hypothetical protein